MAKRIICCSCGHRMNSDDALEAPNPFDQNDVIYGCPNCKGIDSFEAVCDEPGCWKTVGCGTPTNNGYRNTCSQHRPDSA